MSDFIKLILYNVHIFGTIGCIIILKLAQTANDFKTETSMLSMEIATSNQAA